MAKEEIETTLATTALSTAEGKAAVATGTLSTTMNGLKTALIANPWIAVAAAVMVGVTAFNKYKQAQAELAQGTRAAADARAESSSSIEDYAKQYEELHTALLAAKGDEEETYNVKKQLLGLQTELNDKFGDEYGKLNLVTDAYKDQTDAIKAYNKEAAQTYLNENRKGIQQATREMTKDRTYSIGSTGNMSEDYAKDIYDIASKYTEKGIDLKEFSSGDGQTNGYTISFTGDATQAQSVINDLETEIRGLEDTYGDNNFVQGILDNSTYALTKNKNVLDDYQRQYEQAQISEIASDSSLSKGYNEAIDAVKQYNDAVLRSENPYDDENVASTYANLQTVKQGIKENEVEWGQYSNIMGNVFDSASTDVYDFYDTMSNDSGLQKFANELEGLSEVDLKAMADDGSEDSFDKLCESAKKYGLEMQDVIDLLIQLGIVQGEVITAGEDSGKDSNSYSETISELEKMSDAFSSLDSAYANFIDKDNDVTFDNLAKLSEQFKDVSGIENYVKAIQDAKGNTEDTQLAFDSLLSAYLNQTGVLEQVNEGNAQLIQSYLEEQGVANADVLVQQALSNQLGEVALQKYYAANASFDLANATASEINAFINETGNAGMARAALIDLMQAKISCNETGIVTDGDINNLIALANAAGIAESAIRNAKAAQNQKSTPGIRRPSGADEDINYSIASGLKNGIDAEINAPKEYHYSGGTASNSSRGGGSGGGGSKGGSKGGAGASKAEAEEQLKEYDWIERALDAIQRKRSDLEEQADDETKSYRDQKDAIYEIVSSFIKLKKPFL